jgi:hypothetical protein
MTKKKRSKKRKNKLGQVAQRENQHPEMNYQRLSAKTKDMLNQWGFTQEKIKFSEPPDGIKMSEVILKLAEPLIQKYADDFERIEAIISLTIIFWNKMMFPEDKQEKLQDEMIEHLVPGNGNAEDVGVVLYLNDLIMERKKKYFPDLKKIIVSYDLSLSGGNISLNISSAPVSPNAKT